MSASVIKVEHLTRKLAGEVPITLVNDVSLQVESGEFLAITGPSGSGKSSLLYLLGLLDSPSMGSIWIENEDISHYTEEQLASIRLRKLGFIFQFHFLLPEFTALENVMLPMQRLGYLTAEEIFKRASGLLEELGLGSQMNKLPKQLSGGQSQRVAIARALANEPVVILADEPTGNLDSAASQNVQSLLKEIAHHYQRTVIVVTHDTNFAASTDRQLVLVDGHLQ
ncbi:MULTISPECIES: ABC transporter ATP-binding protein [Legionella]|uniref:ABC transporter ATP-binding protein n=1 Tax=Legionella quinlivanii TaxID=45073 RepID=A0A364LKT5_9GAMM|nr:MULTISPECIES: ABC transporter ATP-binding protein [Legionella]MCE3046215.1 ABC transporter ATP-binding protein [Legionella sp. 16cNR16C]RAP37332.1 ABC transporter ATP-binding protein [Legionella quinlivanii]